MSDPWAEFRVPARTDVSPTPTMPEKVSEDPWAAFRIKPQPEKESPGLAGYAADVGESAVRGFNKGLTNIATVPYRALDWIAEKVTGGGGLPDVETMPLYRQFMDQPEPKTTPGQYASKMGEAVGASAIPSGGLMAAAPRMAAIAAPTTTGRAIAQNIGQSITAAPGTAIAIDAASAAAGGAGVQAAQDQGYGPAGQAIAGAIAGMVPGVALAYRTGGAGRIGTETGESIAQRRSQEAIGDIAAADRLGVRQFGPAYNQGPVASVAKQLTETPLVGAPLRNNLDETYFDMASARDRITNAMSPDATFERSGNAVQRGLERFATDRMSDLEPPVLDALNIPTRAPVPRENVMSRGAAEVAREAEPIRQAIGATTATTTRGVQVPANRTSTEFLTTRSTPDVLDDDQLLRIIRAPASETSFATRQEALYERAWRALPELMRSNNTRNSNVVPAVSTRRALRDIDEQVASQIGGQGLIGGDLANRLRNAQAGNFQITDLRSIRTEIGRAMEGPQDPTKATLSRSQLKQLYGATSRDIEVGIETLANRAAVAAAQSFSDADIQTAQQAAGALRAMRTADRYTRQGMERIDRFLQVMRADKPETAAKRIIDGALEGSRGNARMVQSALSSLRPEERSQIAALTVQEMGRPIPSARGVVQESGFSAQSFVTRWNAMRPEARSAVFGEEHASALNDLFRTANRIANVEALANTSRSGTNTMNLAGSAAGITSIVTGDVITPIAVGSGGLATSFLMSTPGYTRWMARYIRIRADVRSGTDRAVAPLLRHITGLTDSARANPQLAPALWSITEEAKELTANR